MPTRWVDEIGSTQAEVVAAARAGAPNGLVLAADHQNQGRGRRGRRWDAPAGSSLLVSVLLAAPASSLVSIAAGLAAADACWDVAGVQCGLKWPNDVVSAAGEKLGGLVAEVVPTVGGLDATDALGGPTPVRVVVGLGLNVTWTTELPAGATDIYRQSGRQIDRRELLQTFLNRLGWRIQQSIPALVGDYRSSCVTVGRDVRADLAAGGVITGKATAVGNRGELLVAGDDGLTHSLMAGDIIHLR